MLKQTKALMAMGVLLAGGCMSQCPLQKVENTPAERENQAPIMVDPAMQLRNWDRSTAYYGNGNVVAGPTGFRYIPRWGQPEPFYVAEEVPLFIAQTIALPVVLILTPPWTPELYTGVTVEPTYTAMPPVPNRSAMSVDEPFMAPTTQP